MALDRYLADLKARAAYLRAQVNGPRAQALQASISTPMGLQEQSISPNMRSIAGSSSKTTETPKFADGSIFR
jgi:hypothetical protein